MRQQRNQSYCAAPPELARRTVFRDGSVLRGDQSSAGPDLSRTIGHKEYAGRAQGKWDPGAIDMDILRGDIQDVIGRVPKPAPTPRPPVPVGEYADVLLFRGSEGPQVAELQRRLNDEEYAQDLVVDGIFGPKTEAAVKAFQRRTRGLKVDGIVGPATSAELRLELVPDEPPTATPRRLKR